MIRRLLMARRLFLAPTLLLFAGAASAQGYKVETIAAAPPQELSPAVREALAGEALRVTGPQGTLCELWLRKQVPAKASPSQEFDITYGQLAQGTLVGAIRFPGDVNDYRAQHVKAGVYTLRYALVPVDANHYGVAPQRDFLLAAPASADPDPATVSRDAVLNLSRKTTGASHPSVWALGPSDAPPASPPAIFHQDDGDMWLLQFAITLQPGSRVAATLVVVGHAPEA